MKSTRLVIGALVATLHLQQPIQCAESEPPKAHRVREIFVTKTCPEVAVPFDEQSLFAPVGEMAYTGKELTVHTMQNGTIVASRKIAEAHNFMPIDSSLSTHHASVKKQTPLKKDAGWQRICKGRTYVEAKLGKQCKKGSLSSRWIQHDDIPAAQETFIAQRVPYLTASNGDLFQQIAQKNEALERIAYEKQQMLDVIKRRVMHKFAAYNICIGHSLEYDKIYKAHAEKKLIAKKAEQKTLDSQLAGYTAHAIQKQSACREEEIEAYWAPTKDMSSLQYLAYCTAYGMSAPSHMTIDEAIQAEFQLPSTKKQHVALLIAHAKKIWPTLQDALQEAGNVPHDIVDQEFLIRDLQEQLSQTMIAEKKEALSTKIAAETTRLQELKLLHFIKSLQCDANVRHIEKSCNELDQQITFIQEHAAQSEAHLRELLPIALYEARKNGLEPIAAIQQVFNMPREIAEFLSHFYTKNDDSDEAPVDQATQENYLEEALQKKYADMRAETISAYEKYLTHDLHKRNVTLIKEKAEGIINESLCKKLLDIEAGFESNYVRYLPYMNKYYVQTVLRKHGARLEACLQKGHATEQVGECGQTLYELPGYAQ